MAGSNRSKRRAERKAEPALDPAERRERLGEHAADDQNAYLDRDDLDRAEALTPTAIDEGDLEAMGGSIAGDPDRATLESLTDRELRAGETDDPVEAAEEGLTYVPPTDPPVTVGRAGEPEFAAGFGSSALDDEPFDADHHSALLTEDDEVSERVREALRADAATTDYADGLEIATDGRTIVLRGSVADIEDEDTVVAVAERVAGTGRVVDELEVVGLD